jgi:hypothetical protein
VVGDNGYTVVQKIIRAGIGVAVIDTSGANFSCYQQIAVVSYNTGAGTVALGPAKARSSPTLTFSAWTTAAEIFS